MQTREVIPIKRKLALRLTLPGSKSITNRAFVCAALARGKTRIYGALKSDDSEVMVRALKKLGIAVRETKEYTEIIGKGGRFKNGRLTLDLHNAGTATRFLAAISVLRKGGTIITGNERMKQRPIRDLAEGLGQMGVKYEYLETEGCPPLFVGELGEVSGRSGYSVRIPGDKSSQYFSALIMLGPMLRKPLRIEVIGNLVSRPYIDTTIAVMKAFGASVVNRGYRIFEIKPRPYKKAIFLVEGDASAATYFTALQYLHGGKVSFRNLNLKKSIQGDARFSEALQKLSAGRSRRISMEAMPDAAMTLAVCAAFTKGETVITGLSTLRIKETDRLEALKNELAKVGVQAKTTRDSIAVSGKSLSENRPFKRSSSVIATYNDHRMAMCFAVLGSLIPGVIIENPRCTDKTYPNFWEDLEKAYLGPIHLKSKNLLLTGMRCSGKTRHGKRLAKVLRRRFVDLDEEIEKLEKMTVPEIVKRKGWPYFRKVEQKICSKFAAADNLVIASGGGVVLDPMNMKSLMRNSVNVFIFTDPGVLLGRITKKQGSRPSLTGRKPEDEIREVWGQRRDLYLKYADFVWDNTSGASLDDSGLIFFDRKKRA